MIVNNTHQKIDALREIMPEGFVFVLDTTDRSFIYKSKNSPDCEQFVISLDQVYGIDGLTKDQNSYTHHDEKTIIKLQKIGGNTYLGICTSNDNNSLEKLSLAENYIK
ncbi:hypothetical protein [Ekhidna sp.]|uniref:hypothetical protein n=1 Tax=Ekhidna sp. TaxID=2608089 RepID=UPI003B509E28